MPHPSEPAPGPAFRVEIDQNPHLPFGGREIHAFVGVTSEAPDEAATDVALRLWTPRDAVVRHVRQVAPTVQDLTARAVARVPQAGDYPTGSWGAERRDYHVCVEVPPGDPGRRMRAGWVRIVLPGGDGAEDRVLAAGNILAEWSADEDTATTRLGRRGLLPSEADNADETTPDTGSTRTVRTRARREPPGPDGTP